MFQHEIFRFFEGYAACKKNQTKKKTHTDKNSLVKDGKKIRKKKKERLPCRQLSLLKVMYDENRLSMQFSSRC